MIMPDIDVNALELVNNTELNRFEIGVSDATAILEYRTYGQRIYFTHTEVPTIFEGKGIGSKLVKGALDYAVANGLKIVPQCPFVATYIKRHPEYAEHVQEA